MCRLVRLTFFFSPRQFIVIIITVVVIVISRPRRDHGHRPVLSPNETVPFCVFRILFQLLTLLPPLANFGAVFTEFFRPNSEKQINKKKTMSDPGSDRAAVDIANDGDLIGSLSKEFFCQDSPGTDRGRERVRGSNVPRVVPSTSVPNRD